MKLPSIPPTPLDSPPPGGCCCCCPRNASTALCHAGSRSCTIRSISARVYVGGGAEGCCPGSGGDSVYPGSGGGDAYVNGGLIGGCCPGSGGDGVYPGSGGGDAYVNGGLIAGTGILVFSSLSASRLVRSILSICSFANCVSTFSRTSISLTAVWPGTTEAISVPYILSTQVAMYSGFLFASKYARVN